MNKMTFDTTSKLEHTSGQQYIVALLMQFWLSCRINTNIIHTHNTPTFMALIPFISCSSRIVVVPVVLLVLLSSITLLLSELTLLLTPPLL